MERLTFEGNFCDIAMCKENPCPYGGSCTQREVWERLKDYEDTGLMPEEIQKMIADATLEHHRLMAINDREAECALICSFALAIWGAEAQTLMVFEEMSELQKELCKHARGRDNREEIAEEIADVRIMLQQMCILHDCEDLADEIMLEKLARLRERAIEAGGVSNEGC